MRPLAILAVLSALGAAGAAHAQAAGQWRDSRQVWDVTCGYCHGASLAPPLLGARPDPALTRFAVRHGPGAMPSFTPTQISDAELKALADWLQTQPAPKPAPAEAKAP